MEFRRKGQNQPRYLCEITKEIYCCWNGGPSVVNHTQTRLWMDSSRCLGKKKNGLTFLFLWVFQMLVHLPEPRTSVAHSETAAASRGRPVFLRQDCGCDFKPGFHPLLAELLQQGGSVWTPRTRPRMSWHTVWPRREMEKTSKAGLNKQSKPVAPFFPHWLKYQEWKEMIIMIIIITKQLHCETAFT